MRRLTLFSALLVAGYAAAASAQQRTPQQKAASGIKLSDVAGTWSVQSTVGPKDSGVATSQVMATADGEGWMTKLEGRDPIPTRIVAMGGDSIVTEAGPFESILRPGQMVNLLRSTGHYKGDTITGTFEAHYASGDVLKGQLTATRKK